MNDWRGGDEVLRPEEQREVTAAGTGFNLDDPNKASSCQKTDSRSLRQDWAGQAVWISLAILVFAPTIYWLCQRWTMSVWHNMHGMFVPFIAAYFIWNQLRSDPLQDAEQSAWGFLFLIPGLAMIALDSAIRTQLLSAFGMVFCLPGFSLLFLGARRTRALTFVWILLFFMLPVPAAFLASFNLSLRRITAVGAEPVIALFVPVSRDDTLLFMPHLTFSIVDSCSGFSPLYAGATLALILAYLNHSWLRRLFILAAVFPVTMAFNVLRVAVLVLMAQAWGQHILDTEIHPVTGLLSSTAGLAVLLLLGSPPKRGGGV